MSHSDTCQGEQRVGPMKLHGASVRTDAIHDLIRNVIGTGDTRELLHGVHQDAFSGLSFKTPAR